MLRKIILDDDERPRRRRRGGGAVAVEPERGLIMRILVRSPKDTLMVGIAVAAVLAIIINATFMQAGRHPSPMFGMSVLSPTSLSSTAAAPLPRVRPGEAEARPVDVKPAEASGQPKSAAVSNNFRPASTVPAARNDHVGNPVVSKRRIASIQRALTEFGYGQIKPTGVIGPDTQAAIQKFERDRKLPITGQLSERLIHDLTILTGRPIE